LALVTSDSIAASSPHSPWAKALAQIAVQIDPHGLVPLPGRLLIRFRLHPFYIKLAAYVGSRKTMRAAFGEAGA
jgi:hypothetical protein